MTTKWHYNGRDVVEGDRPSAIYPVACVIDLPGQPNNGHLLAEAPALLDIARLAVSCWGFMANDLSVSKDERAAALRARDNARDVIARATGENAP